MKVLAGGEDTIIGEPGVFIRNAVATRDKAAAPLGSREELGSARPTAHGVESVIFGSTSIGGEHL